MNQNVTLLRRFRGRVSVVRVPVRPAADPGLHLVRLGRVARGNARRRPRAPRRARQVFLTSLAFVLGFSLVFVALGASATAVGKFLFARLPLLSKIAGVMLIIVRPAHDGRLPARRSSRPRSASRPSGSRPGRSARCWSASRSRSAGRRASVRSSAASWRSPDRRTASCEGRRRCWPSTRSGSGFRSSSRRSRSTSSSPSRSASGSYYHAIEVASGVLLVTIGVLILTGQLTIIVRYLQPYLPVY